LWNWRVCMTKCNGSPTSQPNGRATGRGPLRSRERTTRRVPPPVVVHPVPAIPARAATSHLHQPAPDPLRWSRKRRGHRRPAVGIRDELVAGIGAGGLLGGRAPGQHPGPDPKRVQRHRGRRRHKAEQTGSGPVSPHVLSVAPQPTPDPNEPEPPAPNVRYTVTVPWEHPAHAQASATTRGARRSPGSAPITVNAITPSRPRRAADIACPISPGGDAPSHSP